MTSSRHHRIHLSINTEIITEPLYSFKHEVHLKNILKSSSHLSEHRIRLHYNDKSVILFKDINVLYSENHASMNPINTLRGQNAEFSTVTAGGAYSSHITSMWKTTCNFSHNIAYVTLSETAMKCCLSVGYLIMNCDRNSRDSSVGIATGYGMDSLCSIPGTDTSSQLPDRLWGPVGLPSKGYWGIFPPR
jgi:hypothetical protein